MPNLYFNKESDYSEKNACYIKSFSPPFLKHFSLSLKRKKHGSRQKETKHTHASAANLLHIRIGNLAWCKCRHCKNEVRAIDCLCCREMD